MGQAQLPACPGQFLGMQICFKTFEADALRTRTRLRVIQSRRCSYQARSRGTKNIKAIKEMCGEINVMHM